VGACYLGRGDGLMADNVYAGEPISTEQATRAILNLIKSPMTGDMTKSTVRQLVGYLGPDGTVFPLLSSGEKNLVRLAVEIWAGESPLGGIDKANRRKVLLIMWYFYLGEADWLHAADLTSLTELDFHRTFPTGPEQAPRK
jgi:hypothetical protein